MAKKVGNKRHGGGLEAPRNSLELTMETSYGLYAARDNILYAHDQMQKESYGKDYYSIEAPIKKLISEETFRTPNTRSNGPSVVARLMGVDMLPFDSKPAPQPVDIKDYESSTGKSMDKEGSKGGCGGHYTDWYHHDQFSSSSSTKSNKPKTREHPQEEELQKFKKEFEAWQAARFHECSNVVKFSSAPAQLIAQEELNREKMYIYSNSKRNKNSERLSKPNDHAESIDPHEMLTFGDCKKKNQCHSADGKDFLYSNRSLQTDDRASQFIKSDQELDSAPTKIVILRPDPERMDSSEDLWNSSPSTSEERGSIEDFLEEVKERLKSELQGKCSKTSIRGGGIETPYREKPSKPREIAQCIAQEVRDSVSRDFGMNLLRSESTRSYRSEIKLNGPSSPEFINRDTRRLLADRLRNVLKGEIQPMAVRSSSRYSMSHNNKDRSRDSSIDYQKSYAESFTNELEKQSRSFRGEPDEGGMQHKNLSPMSLVRSLSAPVSATSFGKLLLEDRHVLTGAQIRRKHEAIENVSMNKKRKKEKFNIREKVSSFRYSWTLRGRLFRKRVKSVEGADQNKHHVLKDIRSGPTVMMSFCESHENSTEVPPSPASVCSSIHEEFWRSSDYLSPMSSLGGHQLEDSDVSHVFREINSNLNELRRKLNQLEGADLEETIHDQQPATEIDAVIEDEAEAYIRDLLIAAGLYDGSFSRSLSKWDPLGKPISSQVFEEVEEETCKRSTRDDERCRKDQGEKLSHKMILDLLNEVLPAILREPANMLSRYMDKAPHKPPHGRKLLARVWSSILLYVHPPSDRSHYALDNMLALDLKSNPWSGLMEDDVNAVGKEIECHIIGDMIDEVVRDMCS